MTEELQKRGIATNANAVQVNLARMERDGELVRVRKGAYRVPRDLSGTPDNANTARQEALLAEDGGES